MIDDDRTSEALDDRAIARMEAAEDAALAHMRQAIDRVLDVATGHAHAVADIAAAERRIVSAAIDWRRVSDVDADYWAAAGRLADAVDALIDARGRAS